MLTNETYRVERSWTGVETTFSTGIRLQDVAHLLVSARNSVGAVVLLTRDLHYGITIDGAGLAVVTPIALPAAPQTLILERRTPGTNLATFLDIDRYDKAAYEKAFDKAAMAIADLKGRLTLAEAEAAAAKDLATIAATAQPEWQEIAATITASTFLFDARRSASLVLTISANTEIDVSQLPVEGPTRFPVIYKMTGAFNLTLKRGVNWIALADPYRVDPGFFAYGGIQVRPNGERHWVQGAFGAKVFV